MKSKPNAARFKSRMLFTIVGGAVLINPAFAQEAAQSDTLEEIVVTGLRGSLKASMETKRDAIGVVDAITAEDIGKFPDTNLAESLQRITGVSIDRRNGEGAQVTARGFGPQYNLVTLNGRQMPAADAFGNGQPDTGGFGPQGRSFNFANLASESISGVEVYKTGRADISSGGIGAAINIKTARPFDSDGMVFNVGAKGLYDESQVDGSDITPEVSGIFSFANDDKTWGVGLNASYSKRHSGGVESTVNDWTIREWDPAVNPGAFNANTKFTNTPAVGQLYGIPNDVRYAFADLERERVNAQGVVQFAPMDSLTFTLDYTLAQNKLKQNRGEQTMWLQQSGAFDVVDFDTGHSVATPIHIFEMTASSYANKDFGFEQQLSQQRNELDSIGFNVDWKVTDSFSLALDYHDSKAKSLPDDPTGGSQTAVSFAGVPCPLNVCMGFVAQEYDFSGALPIATRWLFPSEADAAARTRGDANFGFDANHLGSQIMRINYQRQVSEIKQGRLDGALEFDNGRFQFGVDTREMTVNNRSSTNQLNMGNWGATDAGTAVGRSMAELVTPFNLVGLFNDFGTGSASRNGWRGNAYELAKWGFANGYNTWNAGSGTPQGELRYNPIWGNDDTIEEDVNGVYIQLAVKGELGNFPVNFLAGLRYEETDVTSTSVIALPTAVRWEANNDFSIVRSPTLAPYTVDADYNNLLPSFDFDIGLTDTLKGRASYSKTIARAPIGSLVAGDSPGGPSGTTLLNPASRGGGTANDPSLQPYSSDNVDLSLEWYFSDNGYLSVTFWDKRVQNFIGNSIVPMNLYGLTDPTAGPDALAARDFLATNNIALTDTNLFVAAALQRFDTLNTSTFNAALADIANTENAYDLVGEPEDPLYIFNVNRPVNQEAVRIHGWEFGGQYFFGDTGFGVLANYTVVRGDVGYDETLDPSQNQFALLGLSDTANVVLMYENFGFTARLAYNWRDEFLLSANNGGSRNPRFVEAYDQFDLSVGYNFNDHLSLSFDAINLTGEDVRWHGRSENQVFRVEDQSVRYALGARYKF